MLVSIAPPRCLCPSCAGAEIGRGSSLSARWGSVAASLAACKVLITVFARRRGKIAKPAHTGKTGASVLPKDTCGQGSFSSSIQHCNFIPCSESVLRQEGLVVCGAPRPPGAVPALAAAPPRGWLLLSPSCCLP